MPLKVLDATGAPVNMDSLTDIDGSIYLVHTSETKKACYRYCASAITPVATPTDFVVIRGSATMTLRIKRIALGGIATTAGSMPVSLIKRSTSNSGGSTSTVTPGEADNNDPVFSALVNRYTANAASLGTSLGQVGQGRLWLPLVTGQPFPLVWEYATRQDKPLILRGVSDFLCINLNGAAVPAGGVIDFEIQIEEDNS